MLKLSRRILILFLLFVVIQSTAQDSIQTEGISTRLKIFLEGDRIVEDALDNIRNQISFADFVNDPKVADVHIIVIEEQTGGGGYNYAIRFKGNSFNDINEFTLNATVLPGESLQYIYKQMGKTVINGLMPFFNEVPESKNYSLSLQPLKNNLESTQTQIDKWRNWVFKLSLWGGYDYEARIKGYNYVTALKADKVTDKIKVKNYLYLTKKITNYKPDSVIISYRYVYNFYSNTVTLSLSDHWSVRSYLSTYQNTYYNQRFTYSGILSAEYNIFPWDISDKKILSAAYAVGFTSMNFYELTIRNKTRETLPVHKIYIQAKAYQSWGEINTTLMASQYLTDLSLYSLSLSSVFSFRVSKGLTFDFSLNLNGVHDEIYTSAKNYSIEDILLGNIDLPSTIEIGSTVGLTYRFGSIYNNVVNKRL